TRGPPRGGTLPPRCGPGLVTRPQAVFLVSGTPTLGARPSAAAARRSFACLRAVLAGSSSVPEYALCHGRSSAGRVLPRPLSPERFLPPEPVVAPFFAVARRLRFAELPGISGVLLP